MGSLELEFCGVKFKNPVVAASGTFHYGREYSELFPLALLGGVTTKGTSLLPRAGAPGPRVTETPAGMLNAIGLENPGLAAALPELEWLQAQGTRVIFNAYGESPAEFAELARRSQPYCDLFELNLSCPNVAAGHLPFASDPAAAAAAVRAAKDATDRPVIAKLSPEGPVLAVAQSCQAAGADGFSLINTLRGMQIDSTTQKPRLGNLSGGLSGPAIRPLAVYWLYQLARQTDLPLIGMGGVQNWEDGLELALAGAHLVAIGSASFHDPYAAPKLAQGLADFFQDRPDSWRDWVGRAVAKSS